MKNIAIIVLFFCSLPPGKTRTDTFPAPPAYFSAIIVKDLNRSIDWYKKTFGLAVLNKKEFPAMGIKQSNLRRGEMWIELLEIETAAAPENVVPGYTDKTKLVGIFKAGFFVNEFDQWVQHLSPPASSIVTDELPGKKCLSSKTPTATGLRFLKNKVRLSFC